MPIELLRRRQPSDLLPTKGAWRLVTGFEGLSLKSYPDPATGGDPWTAGYGHTGPDVTPGLHITLKQADDWLEEDLAEAAQIVRDNITVPLTQGEFDALTSMAFNLGYIPRSMKACLNGGKTDKGEDMAPGSYGSALRQFPRNCRAAGVPMRGLLRRRLAEACVFSDMPWENACSINLVRLKCDAAGNIDPEETTSLEDTLERARQDIPIQRPDVTSILQKPFPSLMETAVKENIAVEALPKEKLVLTSEMKEQPAAPPVASPVEAKGPEPVSQAPSPPPLAPVPHSGSSKPGSPGPSLDPTAAPQPPRAAPASSSPPKPPPVIAPKTIDINAIPYGQIAPENGAKNMTDSKRGMGMVIVGLGSLTQILAGREIISTTWGAVFYDFSRDPVLVALAVGAVFMAIGWLTRKRGTKIMTDGMRDATQVLK